MHRADDALGLGKEGSCPDEADEERPGDPREQPTGAGSSALWSLLASHRDLALVAERPPGGLPMTLKTWIRRFRESTTATRPSG